MQTVISFCFSYFNISKKQQPKKTTLILETILSSCKTYTNDFLLSVIASFSFLKKNFESKSCTCNATATINIQ